MRTRKSITTRLQLGLYEVNSPIALFAPVATAAALEKREAELADRRRLRAEKLASQTEKAREMSAARRAERVAAGRENIKTFVPRYKRGSGGAGADLKLDPSLRASTTSRRMKDGAMAVGIARRRPPRANAGGRQRRGDGQDAKIQQALNDKIRQARQLQESDETYDYDRNEFDRQSFLLTHEKFDVRRILEKPRLGSDSPAMSDEERFDANKSWLMELAGVKSEQEFAYLKAEALEARAQQRDYDRLMRKRAGLSPFTDNFLAERASLGASVVGSLPPRLAKRHSMGVCSWRAALAEADGPRLRAREEPSAELAQLRVERVAHALQLLQVRAE